MKAIGYVRVSTERQADQGVSLAAQSEKIRAIVLIHDAQLVEVVEDGGESAKSLKRPGMARVLALVEATAVQVLKDPRFWALMFTAFVAGALVTSMPSRRRVMSGYKKGSPRDLWAKPL